MPRKRLDQLGSLQRRVMDAVWDLGEATVQQVRDALSKGENAPAYTTVLSVLQKLEKGGWVGHRPDGRTYIYSAAHSRDEEGASALSRFIDQVFRGDPTLMFQHLLEGEELDEDELAELRRMIDEKKASDA